MIYPKDFETKTGFDVIRKSISELCNSHPGRECVNRMEFITDYEQVVHDLTCVVEMRGVIESDVTYPVPASHDVAPYLTEIKAVNSYMNAERLHRLLAILISFNDVRAFYINEDNRYPALARELAEMQSFPSLISAINSVINKFGEIKDNASNELYEIRQSIRRSQGSMQRMMRSVLENAVRRGIIDKDTTPAVRDGRMVIPVNAGNKREISGIVHDESATGKTVYIEPAEVVEAGNRMRELEIEEKREETRILIRIADSIRPDIDAIMSSCLLLGRLDFITAKARFAIDTNACMPQIHKHPELEWYHAIHPGLLISLRAVGKSVVPLDIKLTSKDRILIVSGPNAGGKSVTLKTIAVVQYMMQCGVMPTLYDNSHMGIFRNVMIDIGDEQSIENELSTYAAHLRNMRFFLQHADKYTLFMADEMGSGTEPQIGGAMAQAILDSLGRSGAYGIVTTHYQNLKTFADNTDGFINGAMMYDRQHLQPMYKLEIGNPGSSFALDIAHKMGLPLDVIAQAKEIVGSDYINMDKYLSDIQRDRRYWNNKRLNIREKEARLDKILENYEDQTGDIKAQRRAIIEEARNEARDIVQGINARIERTILDIRNIQAEKERTKTLRKELNEYVDDVLNSKNSDNKSGLKTLKPLNNKKLKKNRVEEQHKGTRTEEPQPKRELQTGDYVTLDNTSSAKGGPSTVGQILEIKGKKAEVAFGALRTFVDINRLTRAKKPKSSALSESQSIGISTSEASRERQLNFRNEIDVRGMRADEALQAVMYFLDDAIQFNAGRVRILHGTGHGILKTLIRQQLKANSAVADFADEDIRFGGAGITVVNLK